LLPDADTAAAAPAPLHRVRGSNTSGKDRWREVPMPAM